MKIENLVFKGGGVKGACYSGCMEAMEKLNLLQDVERCAGTSAGAIVATLISIGYSPEEITNIVNNLDFKSFKDNFNPLRLLTKYGLYSGNNFIKFLQTCFKNKGLSINLTFKELNNLKLKDKKYKDLYVFSVSLNQKSVQGFSVDRTPNIKIIDAVRASMSIPMFFKSWKIKEFGDQIFIDGGLAYNYPISVFDNDMFLKYGEIINERTIGFFIGTPNNTYKKITDLNYCQPTIYIDALFASLTDVEILNFKRRKQDVDRTIFIPDFSISATNFNITKEEIKNLFDSGYNSTIDYFKKN